MSAGPIEASAPSHRPAMRLDPDCAMAKALALIANKWSVPIVYVLSHAREPVRFRELQRRLAPITQKELTRQLRRLERAGLLARTIHPEVPPRVEYGLTELGETLTTPLGQLARWAFEHGDELEANERAYDGAEPARTD